MPQTLTVSTHVKAPIEKVFSVYTDISKTADRIPAIEKIEILSDGPFGEGTRWRETRVIMKKEATEEMWVTGFNPPHSYNVEAESCGTKYHTVVSFKPEHGGTTVAWDFTGTPQTMGAKILGAIFGVLMKGTMKKMMLGDLNALRDVCEGGEA